MDTEPPFIPFMLCTIAGLVIIAALAYTIVAATHGIAPMLPH